MFFFLNSGHSAYSCPASRGQNMLLLAAPDPTPKTGRQFFVVTHKIPMTLIKSYKFTIFS